MRTRLIAVLTALLVVALGSVGTATAAPPDEQLADVIVVLDSDADAGRAAQRAARDHRAQVTHVYRHALRGYAARVPASRLAALQRNPQIAYVQPNRTVSIQAQQVPTGIQRIFADPNAALRIDGSDERVDVDVAIIDTGIDLDHPDLNVVGGVTCAESGGGPPWARSVSCTNGGDDDHYHGTHVAGTVAALDNGAGVVGVAAGARLHAVKVLSSSGSGTEAMVVAGIDWVTANAATIEVANMSLGGAGHSQAEYDAIQGAVDLGVAFAVAAGNDDDDASGYSPAAFDNVLSVSALADFDGVAGGLGSPTCRTDQDDTLADFSNWGTAVDIAAPGVCILSTYPVGQGSYGTISGTSMASPHVAGALALLASNDNPANSADVDKLYTAVVAAGNTDWSDDSGDGVKERLLDVSTFTASFGTSSGPEPEPEPEPEPTGFSMSATGYKLKGVQHVDLTWSGATTESVDVHRDGAEVVTTANDGAYTDNIGAKGSGSYTYKVCEAGTATCSNTVTVTF